MKTLKSAVLDNVHANSGGVKFLELLTDIVSGMLEGTVESLSNCNALSGDFPQQFETFLDAMQEIKVLRYGWYIDTGAGTVQREKMFVYVPLRNGYPSHAEPRGDEEPVYVPAVETAPEIDTAAADEFVKSVMKNNGLT